jgi:hypothetical protein
MDNEDVSMVTDEHRAKIGIKTQPSRHRVKSVDFFNVRKTLGDTDARYAEGTGVAAPYALSILEPRPTMGMPPDMVPRIFPMGVLTQSDWTVHRPIPLDTDLLATHEVVDVRERMGGRFGRSILLVLRTEFRDESGELVAETSHTITQYDPKGGQKS